MSDAYIAEPKMQAESKTIHIHMNYTCSDSMDMLRRLINCRFIIIINLLYTTVYETRATVK